MLRYGSFSVWRTAPRLAPKTHVDHHGFHQARTLATATQPFRVAVIGSGPAGFYTAYRVMSKIDTAVVDMYEQLPAPFGLVRYGVAPDHPEVKNCQDKFTEVASSPRFNFIGNIGLGTDLSLQDVASNYDAVCFAYGASKDKDLGILGEKTMKGIYSARAFVGWYNGLPEYADLAPDVSSGETSVIIGQGNVALDVARTLLSDVDELRKTDMTEQALEVLSKNRIKRVHITGRRGPLQAAFTIKEVRELMTLKDVYHHPISASYFPPLPADKKLPRAQKRISELLQRQSAISGPASARKHWSLNFLLSPLEFVANPQSGVLKQINFVKTSLAPNSDPWDPNARLAAEAEEEHTLSLSERTLSIPTDLAFRSIGYKAEALPGMADIGVDFNSKKGTIESDIEGRIIPLKGRHFDTLVDEEESTAKDQDFSSGSSSGPAALYCAGWVKRGPTGVIASTMADAFQTGDAIARDWLGSGISRENDPASLSSPVDGGGAGQDVGLKGGWDALKGDVAKKGIRTVSWEDWLRIDEVERRRGKERGKEREKFVRVEDMLRVLD
ncbi:NADPH-adrenodoxin reductase [Agyrium rufum]|nr:NADPH-adrenodoxin reductase [Agyrium rufum]